jgi:hypothetical protein
VVPLFRQFRAKVLNAFVILTWRVTWNSHLILRDYFILILYGRECKLLTLCFMGQYILLGSPFWNSVHLYPSVSVRETKFCTHIKQELQLQLYYVFIAFKDSYRFQGQWGQSLLRSWIARNLEPCSGHGCISELSVLSCDELIHHPNKFNTSR